MPVATRKVRFAVLSRTQIREFRFTGNLDKLTLTIDRPKLSPEDEKRLGEAQRNNHMSE